MMHIPANIQSGKLTVEPINVIIESFINFVFLFFMISAFGMCCGYYEKIKNGRISANDFYTKRYKRIWPYFALLYLVGLAFDRTIWWSLANFRRFNSMFQLIA